MTSPEPQPSSPMSPSTTTPPSEQSSPLNEALPDSLNILFAMDPEKLSDTDIGRIVENLRESRRLWTSKQHEKDIKEAKPKATKSPKPDLASKSASELLDFLSND